MYFIVKIAPDDYFASEVMGADIIAQEIQNLSNSNNYLKAGINSVELIDNILTITGWILEPQCNSNYVLPGVHLWNEENGMLYSLSSGTQNRGDLTTAFPDGTDYSHSGVMAKGSMDQLPIESMDHCKIFLSITRNGEIKYFDTGKYVIPLFPGA